MTISVNNAKIKTSYERRWYNDLSFRYSKSKNRHLRESGSFEKEATIEKAYPNIFVVRYEENNRNVTYSYTDVLTRTVEVDVFDGNSYSPLIPPTFNNKKKNRVEGTSNVTPVQA